MPDVSDSMGHVWRCFRRRSRLPRQDAVELAGNCAHPVDQHACLATVDTDGKTVVTLRQKPGTHRVRVGRVPR